MKTQAAITDSTQRPARNFRARLGGFVILACMLDKAAKPQYVPTEKED